MIVAKFTKQGFIYHDRITIWKNPVTEMQRTKALGLLHKQTKKDSTMSRTGIPDYLLVFRKEGQNNSAVNLDITVDTWQKMGISHLDGHKLFKYLTKGIGKSRKR